MKRNVLVGALAALALTGIFTAPATATQPAPVEPTATINSATLGAYYQDPVWPEIHGCKPTLTATVTGVRSSNLYVMFLANWDDPGYSAWLEISNPIRLRRGDTIVTFTTYAPLRADEYSILKGFRVDLVSHAKGRYRPWVTVASSEDYAVTWDAAACQPSS